MGIDHLEQAVAASRAIARLSAVVATSLAAFARCRPAALLDRQPGEQGAMSAATRNARPAALSEVSEWAVDEVAPSLSVTSAAAGAQLVESLTLVERLPGTLDLLARGELSPAHARQMVNVVGPVEDDVLRAEIEAHVLGLRGRKTPPQLGDCARRVVLRKDADAAARKLVAAVRERGVRLFDRRDGTGTVSIDLPLPAAAAIYRALERYADEARTDGDERTKQQRMADCIQDLVLRPGENGMPPVTVALTLVATLETMLGGAEPGQLEGKLVSAEMVRELAYTLGLLPRPEPDLADLPEPDLADLPDPAAAHPHPEPRPYPPRSEAAPAPTPVEDRTLSEWLALARARNEAAVREALTGAKQAILDGTWTDGEQRALLDVGALVGVRDTDGTGLAHRPHIAVVDKLRGSLVALTDAAGICRGSALGPPPATAGYTPGAALDRFVRLRDRRCRFPGCRARARTCDLDHRQEWPEGATSHENLCCLCEHHHRLKHQAPGWRFDESDDGGLAITMPSGEVLISHPPRFGSDVDVPPF
ncbi:HNH endonuclease signature motif containing protein [Blastococcus sp. LR1]|uniref:HNH endonuclease signature motif containing protein n=1 Tax=Blastococcus sp. LR1 TaxID=2877000 RepID=UPI001CCE277A|nr:HNH endonuclease signature motif containing protein [Blastococcus sp. LR1]MCA0144549.1 HNH endonuclease [Blastococcus sp. LR1]